MTIARTNVISTGIPIPIPNSKELLLFLSVFDGISLVGHSVVIQM